MRISTHGRPVRPARLLSAMAAIVAAGAAGLAVTGPAAAAARPAPAIAARPQTGPGHATLIPRPGSRADDSFPLTNYNSGKCLGTTNGGSNVNAIQWSCNGNPDQQWHWGDTLGGYVIDPNGDFIAAYPLMNGNNNQCLGVLGGSTKEGANVVAWSCNGHDDQYWALDPLITCTKNGAAYNPFINLNSGQVLGVSGNSTSNGASAVQWDYQNACNNQFWG
jgi:hypothetical protein